MKLAAQIASERGKTIQKTGNEFIMIELTNEAREVIARIKVTRPPYIDYLVECFPVVYPNVLMLDIKGHGYKVTAPRICSRCNQPSHKKATDCRYYGSGVGGNEI